MTEKLYARFFRYRAFQRGGSSLFGRVGLSFELTQALLFFLLLFCEFSLSLLKLVTGSCQNCSSRWLFPAPSREALCGHGRNAIGPSSHDDRFAQLAFLRLKSPLAGYLFAQSNPFAIAYRIEVARTKRFVAEKLLFFNASFAGGRTR